MKEIAGFNIMKRTNNGKVKKSADQPTKLNPFELKYNRAKHKVYLIYLIRIGCLIAPKASDLILELKVGIFFHVSLSYILSFISNISYCRYSEQKRYQLRVVHQGYRRKRLLKIGPRHWLWNGKNVGSVIRYGLLFLLSSLLQSIRTCFSLYFECCLSTISRLLISASAKVIT